MTGFDIRSVAVIGGGPGGIASVYELLHTEENGTSTVDLGHGATNARFTKIVGFEQKDACGGLWRPDFSKKDLDVPPQRLLDTEKYNEPEIIDPSVVPPSGVEGASLESPVTAPFDKEARELQWRHSGLYEDLYTNVPTRFTRFSYMENDAKYHDKNRTIYPFMSQTELCGRIRDFVVKENIEDYYRFNSRIESIVKRDDKWVLVVKKIVGEDHEEWYEEEFDAIIIAIGHFTIPVYPHTPGLAQFNKLNPGVISHAHVYREHEPFKDQDILIVGGSISTINALQYVVPIAKSVTVAARGKHALFDWINGAIRSEGIISKPPLKSIDPDSGAVTFEDGSTGGRYRKILYATGYHYHYPFIKDDKFQIKKKGSRRMHNLYYHTFHIEDPTMAFVGVGGSTLLFTTLEASAAAIAGVWSNAATLPPKELQKQWEEERSKEKLFHYYFHTEVRAGFINPMVELFPKNRHDPLETDGDHINDIDTGIESIEKIFYKVKAQKLKIKDTIY